MPLFPLTQSAFQSVIEASWQASILVILIMLVQWVLPRNVSPRVRCAMWGLLFLRLAMPVLPPSPMSLFNLKPQQLVAPRIVMPDKIIKIDLGQIDAPQEPANVPSANPARVPWNTLILFAWTCGSLLVMGRMIIATMRFRRQIRRGASVSDDAVLEQLRQCCELVGLKHPPRIIQTDHVQSPAVFGVVHPVLLMPSGLIEKLNATELRFVLLHEHTHVKSRDELICEIAFLLNADHWFNPMLW